ncbi:MAG TPA: hypothetical protein VGZ32_08555 [Actinocrinis sp.]|jgi:hypothetical protein|uniref:hypothetical protein n=1 Tax=Actinocrinis sp. TaxID=1920516 RepID=UPI002DDD0E93|nr:hypothetical protein [Actinocrinis sp.]HEV3170375.1 hypothetical protein [Actinocrinis sp.]
MLPDPIQVFWYGDEFSWNVTAAEKLTVDCEPTPVDVTGWIAELSSATINDEHWPSVDLAKPLIIVPLPRTDELWPIDGWHRIRRAHAEGIIMLSAHVLSREQERIVRGYGSE